MFSRNGSSAFNVGVNSRFLPLVAGVQREWWHHRYGCEAWFQAERDTRTNDVLKIELAG